MAQVEINEGLIGFYPFSHLDLNDNGTIDDHSGLNNILEAPSVSFFDDDYLGNPGEAVAVAFPDPSAYLALNTKNDNPHFTDLRSFSLSFRIIASNTSSNNDFTPIFSMIGQNGNTFRLMFDNSDRTIHFSNYDANNQKVFSFNSIAKIESNWMNDYDHVSIVHDAQFGFTYLYVNGERDELITIPAKLPSNPSLYFGKDHNGVIADYPMCFDGLHIHNRAILKAEVQVLSQGMTLDLEDELLEKGINVFMYPNPVIDGHLNIILNNLQGSIRVELLNGLGQIISARELESLENLSIPMPETKGIYYVNLVTEKRQYTEKILVK